MTRVLASVAFALLASASAVVASEPGEEAESRWTTSIGSLTIGSGDETATFTDVRSTCNALRLALAFGTAAAEVRKCLPDAESRRVRLDVDAGQVTSATVDPDDEKGRCVAQALSGAQLTGLTCTLHASVSR
jgi:hypothetical protein